MKSVTTKRRANLQVVQQARPPSFSDLENQICDLDRAARIAFLMVMHDAENEGEHLRFFAVEQVERLAAELHQSFYDVCQGKAVRS